MTVQTFKGGAIPHCVKLHTCKCQETQFSATLLHTWITVQYVILISVDGFSFSRFFCLPLSITVLSVYSSHSELVLSISDCGKGWYHVKICHSKPMYKVNQKGHNFKFQNQNVVKY